MDTNYVGIEGLVYPENGKKLFQEDFEKEQDLIGREVINREKDYLTAGIINGFDFNIVENDPVIGAGVGRDNQGRRFVLNESVTVNVPDDGVGYSIVCRHQWFSEEYIPVGDIETKETRKNSAAIEIIRNDDVEPDDIVLYTVSKTEGLLNYEDVRQKCKIKSKGGAEFDEDVVLNQDLIVNGSFFVYGTQTVINVENHNVQDRLITLNAGEVGSGITGNVSGIEIDRGSGQNKAILYYNESVSSWQAGTEGSVRSLLYASGNQTYDGDLTFTGGNIFGLNALRVNAAYLGEDTNYIRYDSAEIQIRSTEDISFYSGGFNKRMTIFADGNIRFYNLDHGTTRRLLFGANDGMWYMDTVNGFYFTADGGIGNSKIYAGDFIEGSSKRFKKDIEDIEDQYSSVIYKLRPIWYRNKHTCEGKPELSHYGLIAEEVADLDPRYVGFGHLDEDLKSVDEGEKKVEDCPLVPDGISYSRLIVPVIAEMQKHENKINSLIERIDKLEKKK
ncbi:MAG: tail fiber domain-containing protein [Spirochaetes bacterium]|nr:tail fiber domain-containing protein [Spirochaetota bacterium]MBN2771283.1 tail fiber domain-containing protein [Spirochaetota bacterium]